MIVPMIVYAMKNMIAIGPPSWITSQSHAPRLIWNTDRIAPKYDRKPSS